MTYTFVTMTDSDRPAFTVWKNRFVDEYNKSKQIRSDCTLLKGVPDSNWNNAKTNNLLPQWIKIGNKNIGYISFNYSRFVNNKTGVSTNISFVEDVYVDKRYRGKGALKSALSTCIANDRNVILIDGMKLNDNLDYYKSLGFEWIEYEPNHELYLVATTQVYTSFQKML